MPINRIYSDGIWEVGEKFSRTWSFSDVNYSVASIEDQKRMFLEYEAILGALEADSTVSININNHHRNAAEFNRKLLVPPKGGDMDRLREEYNDMLREKQSGGNSIEQSKYITVATTRKTIDEARAFFARAGSELQQGFGKLSSHLSELDNSSRLQVFHDFYRQNTDPSILPETIQQRLDDGEFFKDIIAPDGIEFKRDYFKMGNGTFGRVIYLEKYGTYISDRIVTELMDYPRDMMLSINLLPIPTDEAMNEVDNFIMAVDSDISRWQQRQNTNNNFSAEIPRHLKSRRAELDEYMGDLSDNDQHMIMSCVTLVHTATTLAELESDTTALISIGKKHRCEFQTLKWQQEEGLITTLPYGLRPIATMRTLTTESAAVLMPFSVQGVQDKGGIFYGINAVSRNLIICDRNQLQNPHAFILGVSGSGKSFAAKEEITFVALNTDDDIIIIDPEREYGPLVRELGGETVRLSVDSEHHINAMDLIKPPDDDKSDPVLVKSEFILTLCEQLLSDGRMGPKEKSIIDRCVKSTYKDYAKTFEGNPPTLIDFRAELLKQPETEARDIALALELFTSGSLGVFANQTNVNMENRIMLYDTLDLGRQLKSIGLIVMIDAVMNRVMTNRKRGRRTWIYIDEIYLFFASEYSANFLSESWKRFRKYGAPATGITQNVEDCLKSETARSMLSNSEFLIMLNQASTDRAQLAQLLKISDAQLGHITNADKGRGLLKVGGSLVPFINKFPRDTELYRLMTTKPGEE